MSLTNCLLDLPPLEYVIDTSPLVVKPDTPVIDVIALLSGQQNPIPKSLSSNLDGTVKKSSCVLVVEESFSGNTKRTSVLGIFTESNVVRLTAYAIDISQIAIREVMTRQVITLTKSNSENVFTVLSLLRQHRIRHLPILDEKENLVGVVTPESICKALQPANFLKQRKVTEVMTKNTIHAPKTTSVLSLARLLLEQRVSSVVIVEEASNLLQPIGIITERDIVKYQLMGLNLAQTQAQMVMSAPLFFLKPTDSLWFASQEMQRLNVRRLVVTGEQGEFLGILTQSAFLELFDPVELNSVIQPLQQQLEERTAELERVNRKLQREILARREAEEELEKRVIQRTDQLEKQNQLKDDFLNTVSHELRAPASNIKMATMMLEGVLKRAGLLDDEKNNKVFQYFQILRNECQREINLINDLLDLSRLDASAESLVQTSIDLSTWIPNVVKPFVQRSQNHQQNFQLDIDPELPALITDSSYLERILAELLNNACKYTPANELILVNARVVGSKLQLRVTNSGVEIPSDDLPRVFEKFYRIPRNDLWKLGGTGLGLALVKKMVQRLGATISVESSANQTTFIVEFG